MSTGDPHLAHNNGGLESLPDPREVNIASPNQGYHQRQQSAGLAIDTPPNKNSVTSARPLGAANLDWSTHGSMPLGMPLPYSPKGYGHRYKHSHAHSREEEEYHTPMTSPEAMHSAGTLQQPFFSQSPGFMGSSTSPRRAPANSSSPNTNTSPRGSHSSPGRIGNGSRPNWHSFIRFDPQVNEPVGQSHHGPVAQPNSSSDAPATKKTCAKCGQIISGQFVRALGTAFHIQCFTCGDCGAQCASKFFPVDVPKHMATRSTSLLQMPLCERCYFKRLDLLCYRCGGALRGSYITALDRKYHVDHFTCSICPTVFGPEDSYYEHSSDVYCHYHYSTLHASRCEGCKTAILKQFVETYRGGREQQWHPECYMIFKFWNVKLAGAGTLAGLEEAPIQKSGPVPDDVRTQVQKREADVDRLVLSIWSALCLYEEVTAGYISGMVQSAAKCDYRSALAATTSLVNYIQILFESLDVLPEPRGDSKLTKEPKTLCRKMVSYMSLASKSRQNRSSEVPQDFLTVASSIAHYLKVLIRYGLSTSLAADQGSSSRPTLRAFLAGMERKSPKLKVKVTALTSDRCVACEKTVEDQCVCHGDQIWHQDCFRCQKCDRNLLKELDTSVFSELDRLLCHNCHAGELKSEFVLVSKLGQYIFLLRVALARLELVLSEQDVRETSYRATISSPSLLQPSPDSTTLKLQSPSQPDLSDPSTGYISTLADIRLMSPGKSNSQSDRPNQTMERASNLLNGKASLTLDDIRRIVVSEQAREQMPNAFRHHSNMENGAKERLRTTGEKNRAGAGKSECFGNLSDEDYAIVQQIAAMRVLVEFSDLNLDDLQQLARKDSPSFWEKMGKAFGGNKKKGGSGVFGAPLSLVNEKYGVDSTLGVGDYTLRIPAFVDDCVSAMRQKDMSIEGIFRKNGNIRRVREFVEAVEKNPDHTLTLAEEQPIQLAALLKRYLRDMPEPVMGTRLTKLWIQVNAVAKERRPSYLRLLVCLLDRPHRDLLEILVYFLNWAASFAYLDDELGSKMDAHNLATVITPNILLAREEDNGDVHLQAIEAVSLLIEQHLLVAYVPPDVLQLLSQVKERRKDKMSTRELTLLVREIAGQGQLPSVSLASPKSPNAEPQTSNAT